MASAYSMLAGIALMIVAITVILGALSTFGHMSIGKGFGLMALGFFLFVAGMYILMPRKP